MSEKNCSSFGAECVCLIFLLCLSWHKLDIEVAAIVVTPNVKGVKNVAPIRSVHSQPILFAQLLSADWQRFLFAY